MNRDDFFMQLTGFSEKVFKHLRIKENVSPWNWGERYGDPTGVIIHYTAGTNLTSPTRWFMQAKHQGRASAHIIIGKKWPGWAGKLARDFPLVAAMPSPIIQCVPYDMRAQHARRVYQDWYGIELVNTGDKPKGHMDILRVGGKSWEVYPVRQLSTLIYVLQLMRGLPIFGHEHVQRNKKDPGLAFPIDEIRSCVTDPAYSLTTHYADPLRACKFREQVLVEWAIDEGRGISFVPAIKSELVDRLELSGDKPYTRTKDFMMCLNLLGYPLDDVDFSLKTFQRMMKITVDGVPGSQTRKALLTRLREMEILD